MRSVHERSREDIESVLKRVSRDYALGKVNKAKFDKFVKTMDSVKKQLEEMNEDDA